MPLISLRSHSCQVRRGLFSPVHGHLDLLTTAFYHGANFLMSMEANLCLRPPPSLLRSKLFKVFLHGTLLLQPL